MIGFLDELFTALHVLSGSRQCTRRSNMHGSSFTDGTWSAVSAGYYHTCGLKEGGSLLCWGELGVTKGLGVDGCISSALTPYRHMRIHTQSCTNAHTAPKPRHARCVRDIVRPRQGSPLQVQTLAGNSKDGELGDESTTESAVHVAVLNGSTCPAVSAGRIHTCVLKTGGALFCWGALCVYVLGCGGWGGGYTYG